MRSATHVDARIRPQVVVDLDRQLIIHERGGHLGNTRREPRIQVGVRDAVEVIEMCALKHKPKNR